MAGIVQLQRQRSPFEQMLPGFLQNLMFNQMAAKRQDEQLAAQTATAQGKEARGYQAKGWRETGAHANAIRIGDKYYAPPEKGIKYIAKTVGGRSVLVPTETMTPIGGKPQYVKSGTPISGETKTPTTAMAAFLKKHPNATPQQIAAYQQSLRGKGGSVTLGPDGMLNVSWGGGADQQLTKTNITKVQQEVMSNDDRLEGLKNIMDTYESEYTDKWNRLGKSWDEFKENWGVGKPLTATERKELGDYSVWRQNSFKNVNKAVHDFAGGNMTKHELAQKLQELPDPGKKWHQGDSHTVYTRKVANVYKGLSVVNARKKYLLKQGYDQKQIDGMLDSNTIMTIANFERKADEAAVAKRKQLVKQAQQSGADINDPKVMASITQAVIGFLNNEFGFSIGR